MDMNTATLPKKGLKKYDYNIDMDMKDHIATLPKKGLKKYDYNIDMDMKDHIATLPKKGLKTKPYTHICRIKGCGGAGWPPHQ